MGASPMTRMLLAVGAVGAFAIGARAAAAQEMRGVVLQPDSVTPAAGAIVVLRHATRDSILARVLTNARGAWSARLDDATDVRLSVLRIGHRPTEVGPFRLGAEALVVRVILERAPISLATFDVRADARCEVRPDSGRLVAQVYSEVSKALLGASLAAPDGRSTAMYSMFRQVRDPDDGHLLGPERRSTLSGPTDRPFASIPADSLAKVGYMVRDARGDLTFYGPDAEVLLSNSFLASHCLRVADGGRARPDLIGLAFRPTNRGRIVDVAGTLWLERATGELRSLEFRYVGVEPELERANLGGTVDYARLPDGTWFVSRWTIRMPLTTRRLIGNLGDRRRFGPVLRINGIQTDGGEVLSVVRGTHLLYAIEARLDTVTVAEPGAASTAVDSGSRTATRTDVHGADSVSVDGGTARERSAPPPLPPPPSSKLERVGFRERQAQAARGALQAEFFERDTAAARPAASVASLLGGSRIVRFATTGRSADRLAKGSDGCIMYVVVDERLYNASDGEAGGAEFLLDELVDVGSIAAIEVYPSRAAAPLRLQSPRMRSECGVIAVWTK